MKMLITIKLPTVHSI